MPSFARAGLSSGTGFGGREPRIPYCDQPHVLLAALVVVFTASAVQGVTGFGYGLLAIGFLAILFGSKESILILTLMAPLISLVVFARHWRQVDWTEAAWIAGPLLLGTAPGLWLFHGIDATLLRRVVGGMLVLFALWYASPIQPDARRLGRGWAVLAGVSSGFLSGLASTGGPPLVLYLLVMNLEKRTSLAVLQAVFVAGGIVKVTMAGAVGLFTPDVALLSLMLAPAMVAGVLLGQRSFDRLNADTLKRISLLVLGAVGIALVAGL